MCALRHLVAKVVQAGPDRQSLPGWLQAVHTELDAHESRTQCTSDELLEMLDMLTLQARAQTLVLSHGLAASTHACQLSQLMPRRRCVVANWLAV